MYLSRLILNARHPRAKSEWERPYELHRTICRAWDAIDDSRVLFRPEMNDPRTLTALVQSLTEPDWGRLAADGDYLRDVEGPKPFDLNGLRDGMTLRFRLRCRPTKKIGDKGDPNYGKRRALTETQDVIGWLQRKADDCGFALRSADFDRVYWQDSRNGKDGPTLGGVVFDGALVATNATELRTAVANGIGAQKAYGFGLLSLSRG